MNKIKTTLILSLLITTMTHAQVRPDIYNFQPSERTLLFNAMINYITTDVIEDHCQMNMITGGHIHSDFDFLPFHRVYLEGLEDYLLSLGAPYDQFVPLPYWDPSVCAPNEFQTGGPNNNGIDPDCGTVACTGGCANITNWCPNVSLPSYLNLPIQPGSNNDICEWSMDPTWPDPSPNGQGNCCPSGLSRVIEGQLPNPPSSTYHNSVHNLMGGVMLNFRSPAAPIFWLWHAYVDDIWKKWECNCSLGTLPVDLYIKDNSMVVESERDRGEEPNIDNGPMWISDDIWVRNQQDGLTNHEHQNPEYSATQPVYVYVRVRNRGCTTSPPSGFNLNLRWAKASTALAWPAHWDGSLTCTGSGDILGDQVSPTHTKTIPPIPAGGQTIIEFEWNPPYPDDYQNCMSVWDPADWKHFCLLARIEALDDPINFVSVDIYDYVKQNNNVAWKNITIDNELPGLPPPGACDNERRKGGIVAVGNPFDFPDTYNLEFRLPAKYRETHILEEAEIRVELDPVTWDKWAAGGYQAENIEIRREDCRQIIIHNDFAMIKNLHYDEYERSLIFVSFNFLTDKVTSNPEFDYHVIQTRTEDRRIIGGEMYQIKKPARYLFDADAGGDKTISKDDSTTLNANSIGEPAIYNWYDPAGNLVFTGQDFTVSPEVTTKYKLEVIALSDGFVDYDSLIVNVKEFEIKSINPNPATSEITVEYRADNAASAYLLITLAYNNGNNNYILSPAQHSVTINTTNYVPGIYSVVLICDGQAVDVKQLVIQ
ncbi:MAG: tyrosinase family protein [Bacteroidia bacterium]